MWRKIEFRVDICGYKSCKLDKKSIGVPTSFKAGQLKIVDNKKGEQYETIATYGSIDKNGEFIPFCTKNEEKCNKCKLRGVGNCRYNKGLKPEAGYYIEVKES